MKNDGGWNITKVSNSKNEQCPIFPERLIAQVCSDLLGQNGYVPAFAF